jgi:Spy/CpxP family protein refolding chaperone
MKKTLFPLLAALALTIGTATAQDQQRPGPGDQSERMTKELGLSADQTARIKAIDEERRQAMQANRPPNGTRPSREEMASRQKAEHEKYNARYKEVLTPEQYARYTKAQANRPGGKGSEGDTKVKAKKNGKVKAKKIDN